jgi:glycine dehydrogenase
MAEIDRFIEAMIAIKNEINQLGSGQWSLEDNPLRQAPHTAKILTEDWSHPYSRALAVYPVASQHLGKYWPKVRRVDSVHGDRNLICTCPPPEAFA